jgi:hypothetical protein
LVAGCWSLVVGSADRGWMRRGQMVAGEVGVVLVRQ